MSFAFIGILFARFVHFAAGAFKFLQKPVSQGVLLQAIHDAFKISNDD
jgi:FixJ family two-component response regulator